MNYELSGRTLLIDRIQLDFSNFNFLIFSLQCAALRFKNKSLKSKISALNSVD
jgi:hypothetical protein